METAQEGHIVVKSELYPPLIDTDIDCVLWEQTCEMDVTDPEAGTLQFHVVPNDAGIVPFLTAFAKAAAQMPRLKTFALWSPLEFNLSPDDEKYTDFGFSMVSSIPKHVLRAAKAAWGIAYTSPHQQPFADNADVQDTVQRQMWWRTGMWRPHENLYKGFRSIGKDSYSGDMLDWSDNGGLYESQDFQHLRYRYFNM